MLRTDANQDARGSQVSASGKVIHAHLRFLTLAVMPQQDFQSPSPRHSQDFAGSIVHGNFYESWPAASH